jgi:hypothetical protein
MLLRRRGANKNSVVVDYRNLHSLLYKRPERRKVLITRRPPAEVTGRNIYPIWITRIEHPGGVDPSRLHVLEQMVWDQMEMNGEIDVIVDALEYLMMEHGVEQTLRFVSRLRDMAMVMNSNLYVTVSGGIDERTLALLRRLVE